MTTIDPTPASMGGPLSEADRAEVLVEGSWFKVDDLPEILGNFMRSSDEHAREAKALSMKLAEVRARVGMLEGQLATANAKITEHAHLATAVRRLLGSPIRSNVLELLDAIALGLDGGGSDA